MLRWLTKVSLDPRTSSPPNVRIRWGALRLMEDLKERHECDPTNLELPATVLP